MNTYIYIPFPYTYITYFYIDMFVCKGPNAESIHTHTEFVKWIHTYTYPYTYIWDFYIDMFVCKGPNVESTHTHTEFVIWAYHLRENHRHTIDAGVRVRDIYRVDMNIYRFVLGDRVRDKYRVDIYIYRVRDMSLPSSWKL